METIGTIIVWAVLGLAIGAAAKWVMPGPDGGGFVMTSLLGIAGALVGGTIASAIGLGSFRGFSVPGLLIAVLGAVLLLWIWRLIGRGRSAS
jgi:uncharacterized membrane protein YeaQ/YmgE (transglycosylase-associated protein family)